MEKDELARKVRLYLGRVKKSPELKKCSYPLEESGFYRIIGGTWGDGRKEIKTIFHGRFIDAVAFAVQQGKFYADWCDDVDPGNCNHGYVEKIDVCEATTKGLLEAIVEHV